MLFVLLVAVALMQTGAHISQSFVNYPAWQLIGRDSFPAYHRAMTAGAFRFLLVPRVVELALAVVVLLFPPRAIRRSPLVLAIGLALGGLISTVLIQRPIHVQLETIGNTPELLSRLRGTDWIRHVLQMLRAALYLWMLWLVVNPRTDTATGSRGNPVRAA
jgi:hypothetical protein